MIVISNNYINNALTSSHLNGSNPTESGGKLKKKKMKGKERKKENETHLTVATEINSSCLDKSTV